MSNAFNNWIKLGSNDETQGNEFLDQALIANQS